jgi:hypothetical protein
MRELDHPENSVSEHDYRCGLDSPACPAALPALVPLALFIACVEAIRHAVRRRAGIARRDRARGDHAGSMAASPGPTFVLWRRMVLWQVTSYAAAIRIEQDRRHAIAQLQAADGDSWQRAASADVAWMLRTGIHVDQAARQVTAITRHALPTADTGREPIAEGAPDIAQRSCRAPTATSRRTGVRRTSRPCPAGRSRPGGYRAGPSRRGSRAQRRRARAPPRRYRAARPAAPHKAARIPSGPPPAAAQTRTRPDIRIPDRLADPDVSRTLRADMTRTRHRSAIRIRQPDPSTVLRPGAGLTRRRGRTAEMARRSVKAERTIANRRAHHQVRIAAAPTELARAAAFP